MRKRLLPQRPVVSRVFSCLVFVRLRVTVVNSVNYNHPTMAMDAEQGRSRYRLEYHRECAIGEDPAKGVCCLSSFYLRLQLLHTHTACYCHLVPIYFPASAFFWESRDSKKKSWSVGIARDWPDADSYSRLG